MMLEGIEFEVLDLRTNVSTEDFVFAVKEVQPSIIDLSALLTTTMPQMENIIIVLQEEDIRDSVKVMSGGAPVTDNYAKEINCRCLC